MFCMDAALIIHNNLYNNLLHQNHLAVVYIKLRKKKKKKQITSWVYFTSRERWLSFSRAKSKRHNIVLIPRGLWVGRVHNNRGFRIIPKRLVDAEWLRTDYTPQGCGRVCHLRRLWEVLAGDNGMRVPLVEF